MICRLPNMKTLLEVFEWQKLFGFAGTAPASQLRANRRKQ